MRAFYKTWMKTEIERLQLMSSWLRLHGCVISSVWQKWQLFCVACREGGGLTLRRS